MKKPLSDRILAVQTPVIPEVADMIAAHPGTLSLGQGVVFYDPPDAVHAGLARCFQDPANHRYQPVEGIEILRDALTSKLAAENRIPADTGSVVVTAGSNMGFLNALLAICDPGDEVIILKPWYFNHEMAVRLVNCVPVGVETDDDYQPDIARIEDAVNDRTRAVVTISPNNPTGAVYPQDTLDEINRFCAERGLYHISDEAYEYFVHGDTPHYSPASRPGAGAHTISLFSTSKSFSMASWRVGYMLIPGHLFASVRKIQDTNVICPPVPSQYAVLECIKLGRDYCAPMIQSIGEVRRHMLDSLSTLEGVEVPDPGGAFYAFLRLSAEAGMDLEIVRRLISEFGVATIPGRAFGMDRQCYIRVSYGALQSDDAKSGVDRLLVGLKSLL